MNKKMSLPQSPLQRVADAKAVVDRCIASREALGAATAKRAERAARNSWSSGGVLRDQLNDHEAANHASIATDFARNMEELASIAPDLSQLLLDLTEDILSRSRISPSSTATTATTTSTASTSQGMQSPALPAASPVDLRPLLQVVPPTLASLLSFDHLRGSPLIARRLLASLVNLSNALGGGVGGAAA
ncbi:unnamed protein product, partial [Discosporangium mesarthrocarpum]